VKYNLTAPPTAIKTYTGIFFDLAHPKAADVSLFDIAHSLAYQARFNGHTPEFYSVAQHSVHVSRMSGLAFAREGLFHDAAEAYVGDLVSPLKHAIGLERYCEIEREILVVIGQRFGLSLFPKDVAVHEADMRVLATEQRDLMIDHEITVPWEPYDFRIAPQPPEEAELSFLTVFQRLTEAR
jgi:hypothetical protein